MVSVVIPTYNRVHTLGESVESIIAQTYFNWELIVVDDGSVDRTNEFIATKYGDNSQIRYHRIENAGAAYARNAGAAMARGTYLTFLDSDDTADPNWLMEMITSLQDAGAELVSCGIRLIKGGENIKTILPKIQQGIYRGYNAKITNGGSFLLKRQLFDRMGGYDNHARAGQHSELGLRLIAYMADNRLTATTVSKPLINVIDRGGG